ncbi:fibrobacter succinogenes major paralogous domain-containing protein [Flavobacteriaceae bacterium]|nr:fibrobacter succinogenes major paralogous domain-containing protein [Flavobacteriaceae bacterium]
MKKLHTFLAVILITATTFAQAPEKMSYQAVVRDASGALVSEQVVGMRIQIKQGSEFGASVYVETQMPTTNANGLVTLEIGAGTVITGSFNSIEWDNGPYLIETETDPTGGSNYSIIGNSQLLSVPYALYAKNSGNSTPTTPNLESVLSENNSANNQQIKDLQDPTDAQDAVTLSVLLEKISALQDQIDVLQSVTGSGTVTDQDGNTYDFLTYGDQVWTVDNAEMVTYRDGTPIPEVTDQTEWVNLTTGAWAYRDNDPTKPRLYNWYAVMGIHDTDPNTPDKEFAPEGWHVPTDTEWTTLEEHLIANGYNYDGTTIGNKIAKAMASTTGWNSSTNTGDTGNDQSLNNSSGFNAFPVGDRASGSFLNEGGSAFFWSSSENVTINNAWFRYLYYGGSNLYRSTSGFKEDGFSVRFVRD